jgi:hypothetical protein
VSIQFFMFRFVKSMAQVILVEERHVAQQNRQRRLLPCRILLLLRVQMEVLDLLTPVPASFHARQEVPARRGAL